MRVPDRKEEEFGEIIWEYMNVKHEIRDSDLILVLGSIDLLPAERAAELYKQGLAPYVLFTGKGGRNSEKSPRWREGLTEAEMLAEVGMEKGIDEEAIVLEKNSTNTGENIKYSRALLDEEGIKNNSIICSHMPYSLRRDYATLRKQWPGPKFAMTSPEVSFSEYHIRGYQGTMSRHELISDMLGDFQRLFVFSKPDFGFLLPQDKPVPTGVKNAYFELVDRGYTGQLVREKNTLEIMGI